MLFGVTDAQAQQGLVARYSFSGNFKDSSANHFDAVPFGNAVILYDSIRQKNVVNLDGTNRTYVRLGNDTLFNWHGAWTAAFWVRLQSWMGVNWTTLLKKSGAFSFERDIAAERLAFYQWPNFAPTAAPLTPDGRWHHVAATLDGAWQSIYLDGQLTATVPNTGNFLTDTNAVLLGSAEGTSRFANARFDEVRIYNRTLTDAEIEVLAGAHSDQLGGMSHLSEVAGSYQLDVHVVQGKSSGPIRVVFSAYHDTSGYGFAEISGDMLRVGRKLSGVTSYWKISSGVGGPPWDIRILKKGSYYRFWANGATQWIRGPLGEWEGIYEPWKALVGAIVPDSGMIKSFTVTTLPWLQQITQPVISVGPVGSFYEAQVIPGAIIQFGGKYYIYFMAGMNGNQEGAAGRKIGVASSPDLRVWTVQPQPVLSYEQLNGQGDNLYPSGAVITPDGKIALMYAVQKYPEWKGFNLATASDPLGPFTNYAGNPVYQFSNTAHEFDLVRVDGSDHRYVLMFAGFTTSPPSGPVGDRGYAIYSDDLVSWRADPNNPVFGPSTLDNWDAVHVRPRSLNKIGNTWYLWYEGTNTWSTPNSSYGTWWDAVGLARSTDLLHWEYYPRNPSLPALGLSAGQFDNDWIGWPRMWVQNDTGYVFYTGGGQTGMRTIPIGQLTDWVSEGGTVTGVNQHLINRGQERAQEFALDQNYPNPFNPATTIRYSLPVRTHVTLAVFNPLGQQVAMLVQGERDAGYHEVRFDAGRLASGVYFYRLQAGIFVQTDKLLLLK
jgi:hypothetical protein